MKKQDFNSIRDLIRLMSNQHQLKQGLMITRIRKIWEDKMAGAVQNHTTRMWLDGRVLVLVFDSSTLRHHFLYQKDKVVELINSELGEGFLIGIDIR